MVSVEPCIVETRKERKLSGLLLTISAMTPNDPLPDSGLSKATCSASAGIPISDVSGLSILINISNQVSA